MHGLRHVEDLFFRGYDSTVKVLEANGYRRAMPKEKIVFPTRKRQMGEGKSHEEIFRSMVEKSALALKAIKKPVRRGKP